MCLERFNSTLKLDYQYEAKADTKF